MLNKEDWPDGWGILFVAFASNKICGRVRLNKYLSLMQREGFPIKNRFIIETMGPYDKNIATQAESFEKKGLMSIEEKKTNYDSPLYIYKITEEGKEYTENNVIPLLDNMPDRMGLKLSFMSARNFIFRYKIEKIVKDIHEQLFLDDQNQFITELNKTQKQIENKLNDLKEKEKLIEYCHIYLDYLGFFEFTNDSLRAIINEKLNDQYVGKNNVLYNAIELIKRFESTRQSVEKYLNDCRMKGHCSQYPCRIKDDLLSHKFRCVEFNSDLYRIKKSIDHANTDFRELFKINNS